jgi:ribonuclease III family protein
MSAIPEENSPISPPEGFLRLMYVGELTGQQVRQLSPAALAYLGDAVYELYVRSSYLLPPKRLPSYHNQVVKQVRAETQAQQLQTLKSALTDEELNIVRQGRNAASPGPKRVSAQTYQQATGLETLVGYLYLTDPQRLSELLAQLNFDNE